MNKPEENVANRLKHGEIGGDHKKAPPRICWISKN